MNTTEFRSLFPTIISNSLLKDSTLDRVLENMGHYQDSNFYQTSFKVHPEETQWNLEIPLPGAKKEDVKISLKENDKLSIEVTGGSEWSKGIRKDFKLPASADADLITAEMSDGLLSIVVPKKKAFQDKQVIVK